MAVGDFNGDGRPDLAAAAGDRVQVLLNTPGLCDVQPVAGLTLTAAKQSLARGRCAAGTIRRAYSAYVMKGRVISQKPGFGAVLAEGSKVNLVVSKGKRK